MGDFRRQLNLFLIGMGLILSSCSSLISSKPPIILILLESLSEQDYLCSSSGNIEGLNHLQQECEQFIRFTHSFSPSNLLQPNLASLVTGKSISEHKIKDNGPSAISGRFQTLAEQAIFQKMRTGFFSGGAPLLPKFGVSQGYESYFDGFEISGANLFVPVKDNMKKMLNWVDGEVKNDSFFATLYVPDLLYKDLATKDNLDVERPLGRKSGLDEIYESMDYLIGELKKRRLWEKSHVIFLGVSGEPIPLQAINSLSAHHYHMPLQIKMAQKVDHNLSDQVGQLLTFSQVGQWIEKIINHKGTKGALLFSPQREDFFISQENRHLKWLGLANWSHLGLRKREYLFSFNPNLKVYESFIDKKELEPLLQPESDALATKFEIPKKMSAFFPTDCYQYSQKENCLDQEVDKVGLSSLNRLISWSEASPRGDSPADQMTEMIQIAKLEDSDKLVHWLAYRALYEKKWTSLFELGKHEKNSAWMLVSQINLRDNLGAPPEGCLSYFVGERKNVDDFYRVCQNSGLRRVVDGLSRLKLKQKPTDSFWAEVAEIKGQRRALNLNLKMQFVNHLNEPFDFAPKLSELYFFLPENAEYQRLIQIDET